MTAFDVAVVGAGPAGAATARALAACGRRVVLVGNRPRDDRRRAGEVLTPEIGPLLVQLGIWERFVATAPLPVHAIWSAWGGPGAGDGADTVPPVAGKSFMMDPHGTAWCVDRARFDAMMVDAAASAGVRVDERGARVVARRTGGGWTIGRPSARDREDGAREGSREGLDEGLDGGSNESESPVGARFVVDATGRAAVVARGDGARWRPVDRALALVGTGHPRPELTVEASGVLLIESVAGGWWYSCVLPSGELVAALVTDGDLVRGASAGRAAAAWTEALAATELTKLRAAGFALGSVHVRPAARGCLDRTWGPGWVAVGDAASAVDPLSGAGLTKALRGAVVAAAAVNDALAGDPHALARYDEFVQGEFAVSLRTGADYYRLERRWPDAPFWQRRCTRVGDTEQPQGGR